MVQDYMTKFYGEAIKYGKKFSKNPELVKTYVENRRFLKMNWKLIYFTYVHFDGSFVEVPSEFAKSLESPLHHVEYDAEFTFPGRIFETSKANIQVGVYLGDINTQNIVLEAVVCDSKNNKIGREQFTLKGPVEDGVGHFELKFKASDWTTKKLRLRVYGQDEFLTHHFEYGHMMWY
jgi:hypothetical protein